MSEDISILQEIDDALRVDKAHRFWKRYGKLLLAGCVGIVVLTAISAFWKHHLREEQLKQTHVMLQAESIARNGGYADALQELNNYSEWSKERVALVKLQSAELSLKAGQRDKAASLLKEIIASGDPVDETVRDIAVLRLYAITGVAEFSPADREGRPFVAIVHQIKAAQLLKEGKNKEAAVLLRSVLKNAPAFSPERERAEQLLQLTGESADK
jgi:hypothetical protein